MNLTKWDTKILESPGWSLTNISFIISADYPVQYLLQG